MVANEPTQWVTLAVLQARAEPLALAENLRIVDAAAREAHAAGADLLLTPELFVTGYAPQRIRAEISPTAVAEMTDALVAIAADRKIALAFSTPGTGPASDRSITATLVDARGAVVLSYAKTHLFGPHEHASFRPGVGAPPVARLFGLNVSLLICYDVEFPETVRSAATRGANLVLVPTALGSGYENVARVLVPARALENTVTVAYANHVDVEEGLDLAGASVIAGPDGDLLADAGRDIGLIYGKVRAGPAEDEGEINYLNDRRPELYREWDALPAESGPTPGPTTQPR